jgi:F-type H+-transporting ATPase subunit gamma
MANTRELRRRIRSVKNTSQITKAMQMVAATKMRRAQNQATSGRPYSENLNFSVSTLLPKVDLTTHPLLSGVIPAKEGIQDRSSSGSPVKPGMTSSVGVILLSTNKSLCGALNTNLFRAVQQKFGNEHSIKYFSYGLKGRNFIVRTGKTLEADFENPEVVAFKQARQISNLVKNAFLEGLVKEVYLAFPDFVSTLRQEPTIIKLLPIDPTVIPLNKGIQLTESVGNEGKPQSRESHSGVDSRLRGNDKMGEFLFEPNVDELLDFVLVHHIETQIYQALLETKASEHSARMMAMQNATDNAKELVEDLNLTYNQTRQAAITNELLEITTAAAAME